MTTIALGATQLPRRSNKVEPETPADQEKQGTSGKPEQAEPEAITGPYVDAARIARIVIGKTTNRGVTIKTNIAHTTIGTMKQGGKVDMQTAIKFSRYYKINPNRLLRAYGHDAQDEYDLVPWANDAALAKALEGQPYKEAQEPEPPPTVVREVSTIYELPPLPETDVKPEVFLRFLAELHIRQEDGTWRLVRLEDLTEERIPGLLAWLSAFLKSGRELGPVPLPEPCEEPEGETKEA